MIKNILKVLESVGDGIAGLDLAFNDYQRIYIDTTGDNPNRVRLVNWKNGGLKGLLSNDGSRVFIDVEYVDNDHLKAIVENFYNQVVDC